MRGLQLAGAALTWGAFLLYIVVLLLLLAVYRASGWCLFRRSLS